jgi:short-subunit dehydrogenase
MELKNKTIIITGSTGGIGRELAKNLDEAGANLVLISKSEDELLSLINKLKGKNNCHFACDFSDQNESQKLVDSLSEKFKNIDVLINAAGIGVYKPIEDATLEEWNNSLAINVTSHFLMVKGLVESLKATNNSLVLNIGSGMGVIPTAGRSLYCASKFAVRGFTLSLAEEFKGTKTHFCLITLGSTLTPFGPKSFEDKKKEMEEGKAYFTPEWVAKKLTEIIKDDNRDIEYTLYPGDYGLGWWKPS